MNDKQVSPYRNDLLSGQIALVTGAGKGIGRQCALSLANAGAHVIAVSRTKEDLISLKKESKNRIEPLVADATSSELIDYVSSKTDISILVNNLGTNNPQPFTEVDEFTLQNMINMNIISVFKITQKVVNNLLTASKPGSIINISSQMGHVGSPKRTVYCTTKHAIEGLTKALGVELGQSNIRVNSVCPTFIETPMTKPMLDDPEFSKFVLDKIPLGHIGKTIDVANAVVFLASEASSLITGSSIMVDGGWTAQ